MAQWHRDTHLFSIDDIHDHAALQHLRQTGLDDEVGGGGVAIGGGLGLLRGHYGIYVRERGWAKNGVSILSKGRC